MDVILWETSDTGRVLQEAQAAVPFPGTHPAQKEIEKRPAKDKSELKSHYENYRTPKAVKRGSPLN